MAIGTHISSKAILNSIPAHNAVNDKITFVKLATLQFNSFVFSCMYDMYVHTYIKLTILRQRFKLCKNVTIHTSYIRPIDLQLQPTYYSCVKIGTNAFTNCLHKLKQIWVTPNQILRKFYLSECVYLNQQLFYRITEPFEISCIVLL